MNLNCSPLFASLRYECLPWTRDSNARLIRDNETNTDVLIPLYQLKHGVSAISDFYTVVDVGHVIRSLYGFDADPDDNPWGTFSFVLDK